VEEHTNARNIQTMRFLPTEQTSAKRNLSRRKTTIFRYLILIINMVAQRGTNKLVVYRIVR
jgi:hypothetical protein